MDLALEWAIDGRLERAARACHVATGLAGSNRFILRSAARFWHHYGDIERAQSTVDNSPATPRDPWLLSTSVALGDLSEKASPHYRLAKRVAEARDVSPWHLSELTAALATIEWSNGSDKRGRQLMRRAIVEPTENVLAQAEWANEKRLIDLELNIEVTNGYEAKARHWAGSLEWNSASDSADEWLDDQPFSVDAALFGSWSSSQQDDLKRSMEFCRRGRIANPKNPWLANNLAYALAREGAPSEAERMVIEGRRMSPSAQQRAYLTATEGLVHFRKGDVEVGRRCYEEAISHLIALGRRDESTMAKLILAEEEIIARTDHAKVALERAENAVKTSEANYVSERWKRLESLGETYLVRNRDQALSSDHIP